jgi:hypothetical protein
MSGSMVAAPASAMWQSARSTTRVWQTWLPILLVAAALLPEDLNIRPGGLLLTMPRIVLLASMPFLVFVLFGRLARGNFRIRACDLFVGAAAIWMFISVCMTQGLARAFIGSSVLILELCGTYLLVRCCLTGTADAIKVARWAAYLLAANALLSVLDVVTGRHILHDMAEAITHYGKPWRFDYRDGLLRSQGMQEHPILLGVVCACGAVLSLGMMKGFTRIALCLCCLVGLAASNSSAPIGAFVFGCLLFVYHRFTPGFSRRWQVLTIGSVTALALLLTLHPRPFSFLVDHFTANPQDGYYRLLIWSLCGPLVLDNPLYGVGMESDFAERFGVAQTVDSVWLASAMNFGIPGAMLIGAILLSSCARPVLPVTRDRANLGRALGIIIFLYIYLGLTVDFWGCTWILMGFFAALRVHVAEAGGA